MARMAGGSTVFQAIASPTRRAILDALMAGERNVTALVAAVNVSQSALSQQLNVLADAGLVHERAQGRFRYYSVRVAPLAEVHEWIAGYRALMEAQLDALGRVLDDMPDDETGKRR